MPNASRESDISFFNVSVVTRPRTDPESTAREFYALSTVLFGPVSVTCMGDLNPRTLESNATQDHLNGMCLTPLSSLKHGAAPCEEEKVVSFNDRM